MDSEPQFCVQRLHQNNYISRVKKERMYKMSCIIQVNYPLSKVAQEYSGSQLVFE